MKTFEYVAEILYNVGSIPFPKPGRKRINVQFPSLGYLYVTLDL